MQARCLFRARIAPVSLAVHDIGQPGGKGGWARAENGDFLAAWILPGLSFQIDETMVSGVALQGTDGYAFVLLAPVAVIAIPGRDPSYPW